MHDVLEHVPDEAPQQAVPGELPDVLLLVAHRRLGQTGPAGEDVPAEGERPLTETEEQAGPAGLEVVDRN